MHTIIVGAGSAGGALAARLTEDPDHEVTLIEAGPDFPRAEDVPPPVQDAYEMSVEGFDWGLQAYFLEPAAARAPQPYPRGRIVGGSSAVNAAIAQRATVEDMASWEADGNTGWSWDDVLPYFKRLETDLDFGERPAHGTDGPVPIFRHAPDEWAPAVRAFVQACRDRGFPACEDFNEPGATGVGPAPRNQIGTVRASSLVTYLAEARQRPNLTILADSLVTRVLFDGTRAVGVEYAASGAPVAYAGTTTPADLGGEMNHVLADRVVLSAGAIHTPHILLLSGVGPAEVLAEQGIEPVIVSDGVGRNLQDHPFVPVLTLMKEPTEDVGVRAELKFTSKDAGELIDDMMIFGSVLDPTTMNLEVDTGGKKALFLVSLLAKPRSIGWLTLSSPDYKVQPELHVNLSADPSDVSRLMESVRLAYDIATSSPVADEIDQILFPDAETVADDEKLEAFVRSISNTSYHGSCTCRMGPDGDPLAVVDQGLAVRGAENLWIADASVMVRVPTGLTNLTSYMIGERMAELLSKTPTSMAGDPNV